MDVDNIYSNGMSDLRKVSIDKQSSYTNLIIHKTDMSEWFDPEKTLESVENQILQLQEAWIVKWMNPNLPRTPQLRLNEMREYRKKLLILLWRQDEIDKEEYNKKT